MGNVDDKLFEKYSNNKNFNSFINEFDCATNEEYKEKVAKELKEIFLLSITLKWMKIVNTDLHYLILLMLFSVFCMNTLKKMSE